MKAGNYVKVLTRDPKRLQGKPWAAAVEVISGDLKSKTVCKQALNGVDVAYYLAHSMGHGKLFIDEEAAAAHSFTEAANETDLRRVVYLGGMSTPQESKQNLSQHMASRHQVGDILRAGNTPTTELRAAVIIGGGSLPFEMLRHLVEVLPVMTTPKWTSTRCQPIAIQDVIHYLARCAEDHSSDDHLFDIGGPDIVTYSELMKMYAECAGIRPRLEIPLPFLSPGLSSHWVGLVTPIPNATARDIVESLRHEVVVINPIGHYDDHQPISASEAMEIAVTNAPSVPTEHPDWGRSGIYGEIMPGDPYWSGRKALTEVVRRRSSATPEQLMATVLDFGKDRDYLTANFLWRIRGRIDKVFGGPGMGGSRPEKLSSGDTFDFWEVNAVSRKGLLLEAKMKLPGRAWLCFTVNPDGPGSSLSQRAIFYPVGISGRLYWYIIWPLHKVIFRRMCKSLVDKAALQELAM